jgi:hypothetical protein
VRVRAAASRRATPIEILFGSWAPLEAPAATAEKPQGKLSNGYDENKDGRSRATSIWSPAAGTKGSSTPTLSFQDYAAEGILEARLVARPSSL